jgi:hypothetical protein
MAIVRNIQNNFLYRYLGENKYRNLTTLQDGEVPEEKAREIFRINIEATSILNEYPEIENMINKLQLKFEK